MTPPTDPRAVELVEALAVVDAATRRQYGRLRGAVQALDWARVRRWVLPGFGPSTPAALAELSGVPVDVIAAGLASVEQERRA